jgi:DNA repair protein RecO (recombination protein O)
VAESTEGIVLRRIDYSETSLVLHFYTPDVGQLAALAKGAKRPKSRFQGGIDLLTRNQIVFARRGPEGLATLMESAILDDYLGLRRDLDRLIRAQYCAELVALLTTQEDPNAGLYDLLVQTLERLAEGPADIIASTIRFEIGVLAAVGYGIDWEHCIACGRQFSGQAGGSLSPAAGGVVCLDCDGPSRRTSALGAGVLAAARLLASAARRAPLGASLRRADRLRLPRAQVEPLGRALGRYVTYLVGRPPKMLQYLGLTGGATGSPARPLKKVEGHGSKVEVKKAKRS